MKKTLVMYEVSQKQQYIFRSNKLKENIGASLIIKLLTEQPDKLFEQGEWQDLCGGDVPKAEYSIYGGGNAVYIFATAEEAERFANVLSLGVLKNLPGIELFLVKQTMDWELDRLYDRKDEKGEPTLGVLSQMRAQLAEKKNRRLHGVRQISWGIHQKCPDSGLPANSFTSETDSPRARELHVKAKYGSRDPRNDMFVKRFLHGLRVTSASGKQLQFLEQEHLEKVLGDEKTAKNYVAVVHIDGNAMGRKVSAFLGQPFKSNEDYVKEYKSFTDQIEQAYTNAFRAMIEHVMNDYPNWAKLIYGKADDANAAEKTYAEYSHIVPVRPIIASGDDICFLTYGQLGIELARVFIQYLQQQKPMEIGRTTFYFEACAGVAIVRRKFPFWLAYEMADQLCANAKKRLKKEENYWSSKGMKQYDSSLIDWELVRSGDVNLDVSARRSLTHRTKDGAWLVNRPYYLQRETDIRLRHPANYTSAFLPALKLVMSSSEAKEKRTGPPRSKWKALLDVYHQGVTAVNQWQVQNQFDIGQCLFLKQEPTGEHVAYFYDAIEIMDYVIPLPEVKVQ